MKRKRFSEEQIIAVLREHDAGAKAADLARKYGVSEASLYNWRRCVVARRARSPFSGRAGLRSARLRSPAVGLLSSHPNPPRATAFVMRLAFFARFHSSNSTGRSKRKALLAPGGLIYDLKGVRPPSASHARI